jgi:hypothetical protein
MGRIQSAVLGALGTRNIFMEAGKATKQRKLAEKQAGTEIQMMQVGENEFEPELTQNITPNVAKAYVNEELRNAEVARKKGDYLTAERHEETAKFYQKQFIGEANSKAADKFDAKVSQLDSFSLNTKAIKAYLAMSMINQKDDEEDDKYGK